MSLAGAAPFVLLSIGALVARRGGRVGGFGVLLAALIAIVALALFGRTSSFGTFAGDPFSLFLGGLLVVALALTLALDRGKDTSRLFVTAAALTLAVSSRDLLAIYLGFEAFSFVTLGVRKSSLASSALAMTGLLVVAVSSGGTDLASLQPTSWSNVGFLLFTIGITGKWLFAAAEAGFESLGAGIALVALWIRAQSWVPELTPVWIPIGVTTILLGGLGSALSGRTPSFLAWLAVSQVGVAGIGISGGAPALPHVLMHLAAATLSILLMSLVIEGEKSRSALAVWILALSVASLPPLPGFVTKLGFLAGLPGGLLGAALLGSFLVGVGCARLVARTTESRRIVSPALLAVVLVIALGVFPDAMFRLAALAANGLF